MLILQERIEEREDLRVVRTSSAASIVAQQLNPDATTVEAQQRAIRLATPAAIDAAVRRADESSGFEGLLSNDYNSQMASASATIGSVQHEVPAGLSTSAGAGGTSPLTDIQRSVDHIAQSSQGDFTVFGPGIISGELSRVVGDSLAIVVPAAALLITVFLAFAYRDPLDLLLGVFALIMTLIWTFGFMGLAGIPFGQMLISIPVLLLAVGIDFGIHIVNRYREERADGVEIHEAMSRTTDQLLVAFFIVTGTTVIGFGANLISDLGPIRDFGLIAAIGIVFTFLIFGVFLPSLKIIFDEKRDQLGLPTFGTTPIGSSDSLFTRGLTLGNWFAKQAPKAFFAFILITGAIAGSYGTGVDTSFSNEDFLPPEEAPGYVEALPEPFEPGDYSVTSTLNLLEDKFESTQSSSITIYIEGSLRQDDVLQQIHRANRDPPSALVSNDRRAHPESILSVIEDRRVQDPKFAQLVARNDRNGDGIPDDNLEQIYDYLLSSSARGEALNYITNDYRSTRVVFSTESDASQDEVTAAAQEIASRYRLNAVATGQTIVFAAITDVIFSSAIQSLMFALLATGIFLIVIYWFFEGVPSYGIIYIIPIMWTSAVLAGSMRFFNIPLNVLTATILSIAIGLGIDYSSHFVHRFADEYESTESIHDALNDTVRGTGGALAGSMLTTTTGTGVLALAITPILGQFGLVIALSVFISFIASVLITPPVVVVWEQLLNTQIMNQIYTNQINQ